MGSDSAQLRSGDQSSLGEKAVSTFSRRQLLWRSAAALGGITGAGLFDPSSVFASATAAAQPIPGGFRLPNFDVVPSGADLHVLTPALGSEMSSITDFNGVIGGSETRGKARGSDGSTYDFDCDMRFMQGVYVGLDGRLHNASFGFI